MGENGYEPAHCVIPYQSGKICQGFRQQKGRVGRARSTHRSSRSGFDLNNFFSLSSASLCRGICEMALV